MVTYCKQSSIDYRNSRDHCDALVQQYNHDPNKITEIHNCYRAVPKEYPFLSSISGPLAWDAALAKSAQDSINFPKSKDDVFVISAKRHDHKYAQNLGWMFNGSIKQWYDELECWDGRQVTCEDGHLRNMMTHSHVGCALAPSDYKMGELRCNYR